MSHRSRWLITLVLAAGALSVAGCEIAKPYDYTNFRAHPPRSILVLPPVNSSTDVKGTYGYLSTVTQPLAERGYYVFPVAVVDQFMKDNGLPAAGEMQQVPLAKIAEVIGADAVLYVEIKQYGTRYELIASNTTVEVVAKLVDTRTGILLWEGRGLAQQGASVSADSVVGLVADLIEVTLAQVISKVSDHAHVVSRKANEALFTPEKAGLPYGPYSPKYQVTPVTPVSENADGGRNPKP